MKKNSIILLVVVILLLAWAAFVYKKQNHVVVVINSYEDCVKAGYPVMESYPEQCKTPDGRTYTNVIKIKPTYKNASAETIVVDLPTPGAVVGKEFSVIGKAKGFYFEASFPVQVLDKNGNILWQGPAQAIGDWMTAEFVPFKLDIKIKSAYMGPGLLILKKDNPSGMPENDGSMSIPINIEY